MKEMVLVNVRYYSHGLRVLPMCTWVSLVSFVMGHEGWERTGKLLALTFQLSEARRYRCFDIIKSVILCALHIDVERAAVVILRVASR